MAPLGSNDLAVSLAPRDAKGDSARAVELIEEASCEARPVRDEEAEGLDAARAAALCNKNIRMMFIYQVIASLAYGVVQGPVFDKYLYYLGGGQAKGPTFAHGRNSLVGMTESVSGLACLFLAAPVGLLVDSRPSERARLLRISAVVAVISGLLTAVACLTDVLLLMYAALVLAGVYTELSMSATEALFADSIPQGRRASLFVTKSVLSTVGSACGPLLAALGLLLLGDEWKPYQMKAVIVIGAVLLPAACAPLYFFQDPPAACREAGEGAEGGSEASREASTATSPSRSSDDQSLPRGRQFGFLNGKHVPFLLAIANFISCIGAGMTVKFFNLFFIEDLRFTGVDICLLQTAYPLVIAIFMKWTERVAKPLGRAQASCLFFSMNILCLILLAKVESLPVLLVVFMVRGGFANATYPLDRSILMDFTPSSQRGRWNAVESLTAMTWSGSAFLGGMLADKHDYRFTFLITAVVYACSIAAYSPLMVLVPKREDAVAAGGVEREVALIAAQGQAEVAADKGSPPAAPAS